MTPPRTPRALAVSLAFVSLAWGHAARPTVAAADPPAPAYPWSHDEKAGTVAERFPVPGGCTEDGLPAGSFPAWLAGLPLAPPGTEVRDARGRALDPFSPALAVVDVDLLGPQDCADSAIRLRSEFLWSKGMTEGLRYKYLSGDEIPWGRWAQGCRPKLNLLRSRVARWVCDEKPSTTHDDFRDYLASVMRYASSASLARDLERIDAAELGPGDLVIQPHPAGQPGHVVIALRRIRCEEGKPRYLFANGFLPPQSVHVIGLRVASPPSPWFGLREYQLQMNPLGTDYEFHRFPRAPGE